MRKVMPRYILLAPLSLTLCVMACAEDPEPLPPLLITDMGMDMPRDMGKLPRDMGPFVIPDIPEPPKCDPNEEDLPDIFGFDTNCDGIDGDEAASIFVASYGDDEASGTKFEPMLTIKAALDRAAEDPTKTWVLLQEGLYEGPVSLKSGVSIAGGYELGWARDGNGFSTIKGSSSVLKGRPVLRGDGIVDTTYVMNLELRPEEQIDQGDSVFTVVLLESPAVIFERMFIIGGTAGRGFDGMTGTPGDNGARGGNGGNGAESSSGLCSDKSRPSAGSPGTSSCGSAGGTGGRPGRSDNSGDGGTAGSPSEDGEPGGSAGGGGSKQSRGKDGQPGPDGLPGQAGQGAIGGGAFDNFDWIAASGQEGTAGSYGGGGGGAGGGGGGEKNCDSYGGAGGGGGGGGCGGAGGQGGSPGGASVAIFLRGSDGFQIRKSRIAIGYGGAGGRGGNGGVGGDPGKGGTGGKRDDDDGMGGNGGDGGRGGAGGSGGGGAGGPAFAIYSDANLLTAPSEITIIDGGVGVGGGGSGDNGRGANGITTDIQVGPVMP